MPSGEQQRFVSSFQADGTDFEFPLFLPAPPWFVPLTHSDILETILTSIQGNPKLYHLEHVLCSLNGNVISTKLQLLLSFKSQTAEWILAQRKMLLSAFIDYVPVLFFLLDANQRPIDIPLALGEMNFCERGEASAKHPCSKRVLEVVGCGGYLYLELHKFSMAEQASSIQTERAGL